MPGTTARSTIDVPSYQLDPVIVALANLKEVFANGAERMKLIEANS